MEEKRFDPYQFIGFILIALILTWMLYQNNPENYPAEKNKVTNVEPSENKNGSIDNKNIENGFIKSSDDLANLFVKPSLDFEQIENQKIEIEASLSGVSGNQFKLDGTTYEFNATATLAVSATSIGFAAKQKVELAEGVMLYGKVGIHQWDSELNITSTTTTANADDDGTDVFWGAGLEASMMNLKGRIGYSLYDLDGEDIDSINVGFIYNF